MASRRILALKFHPNEDAEQVDDLHRGGDTSSQASERVKILCHARHFLLLHSRPFQSSLSLVEAMDVPNHQLVTGERDNPDYRSL